MGLGVLSLYPTVATSYTLGKRADFPAALPADCSLAQGRGVFEIAQPPCFVVHLSAATVWQETGVERQNHIDANFITIDTDGSYWLVVSRKPQFGLGDKRLFFQECNQTFIDDWLGGVFDILGDVLAGPAFHIWRFPMHFSKDALTIPRAPKLVDTYLSRFTFFYDANYVFHDVREAHRLAPYDPMKHDPYCSYSTNK